MDVTVGTIKKAGHWRVESFHWKCWGRLLRVHWMARRSKKSILKEINPEHSLKDLLQKFQYFGHLMKRVDWKEKTLMQGKQEGREEDNRRWDGWMVSQDSRYMSLSKLREMWRTRNPSVLQFMGSHRVIDMTYQLNNNSTKELLV